MSDVDLTQDPKDFLNQALNPGGADPQGQPANPNPAGAPPTETPKVPENGAPAQPPVAPKLPESKPEEQKPSADPKGQPKTVEQIQKDHDEATRKITELGEAKAQLFKTYIGLVESDPNVIKTLHKQNPELANQIVKEHWKYDSYEELMEHARIEALRDEDPEQAKQAEEILNIKKDNRTLLAQSRTSAETAFYTAKGIMNNPFDPKFQAIQEALKNVSSELQRTNYPKALEVAYTIAYPGRTDKEVEEEKKKIALAAAGNPESKGGGGGNPANQPKHSATQSGFASMVGAKLN